VVLLLVSQWSVLWDPTVRLFSGPVVRSLGIQWSVFGDPAVRFCEIQRFLCFGIWWSGILRSSGPCSGIQRSVLLYTAGHSCRTSFLDKFSVRDIRREVGPGWVGPLNKSPYLSYKMSIRWTIGTTTGKRPLGKMLYSTVFE
jgi:hypothetical protein